MNPKHAQRLLLVAVALSSAACASRSRRNPLPIELRPVAEIPGMPKARNWSDRAPPGVDEWFAMSSEELHELYAGIVDREHNYLAISGGGSRGAYGAGLLTGWTESGTRPEFTFVTGVSTGALIAPFAFLGPDYDHVLEEMYSQYSTDDLVKTRTLIRTVTSDAAASTDGLRDLIERYVDDEVIDAIEREYRRGRQLVVGTTNLDAARPVSWNIGRIAASGAPGSRALIHDVLLASASIPGAFPPVMIDVVADGEVYDEMHVDGGTAAQVFLFPMELNWDDVVRRLGVPGRPTVYCIRNAQLSHTYAPVKRTLFPIVGRTIDSLLRTQGIGDLYRIYLQCLRDNLSFRLSYIPDAFDVTETEVFDPVYMRALFQLGLELGRTRNWWHDAPPGFAAPEGAK